MSSFRFNYPIIKRDEEQKELRFNKCVEDPYRYLEDPKAEVTKQFVEAQNAITEPYLGNCPKRSRIKEILTRSQDYSREGCFFKRGTKYYFFRNSGLQPQAVLYQLDSLESEPRVFFDPNKLSDDGTVALTQTSFSPNNEYFAYAISRSGSDWCEISVLEVATGNQLPDSLTKAKFTSICWSHDNRGFFYAMYPSTKDQTQEISPDRNEFHSVYYHVLGRDQSDDILKVDLPDKPKWRISFQVSHDGKHLHIFPREGCSDCLWYYCELNEDVLWSKEKLKLIPLYEKLDAQFDYITNNGDEVYFLTNLEADNFRICKMDITKPSKEFWIDIIGNNPTDVIDSAEAYTVDGKDYLLINYVRNVVNELQLHDFEGKLLKKFNLQPGTIFKASARREHDEIFFQFTSFLTPGQTYLFKLRDINNEPKLINQSSPNNFNPDEYQTEQVFYESKDGAKIPMFIVSRKDLVKDGSNPCILYGYGGFNIRISPAFNINRLTWFRNFRGLLAVANIRGGGEFGQNWHDSGRLLKKQNCFNDFISAAEFLIDKKYTRKDKLAIQGGSNGGLLVAACSNQRPDLFGATICQVGVLDMLRFTKFTVGDAWTEDYGDPDEEEHFHNLFSYSPYHNIPAETSEYPATLLMTADHDDRVVPAHSLKFIAQLQYKLGQKLPDTPLIIRLDTKAGHGSGKPTSKIIDEYTDMYSFLYNALELEDYFSD